jgi:hypothetical protein
MTENRGIVEKIETWAVRSKSLYFLHLVDFMGFSWKAGGETGIRTLDTLRYTRFPSVRLQPLGHLSAVLRAFLNLTQSGITRETIT